MQYNAIVNANARKSHNSRAANTTQIVIKKVQLDELGQRGWNDECDADTARKHPQTRTIKIKMNWKPNWSKEM